MLRSKTKELSIYRRGNESLLYHYIRAYIRTYFEAKQCGRGSVIAIFRFWCQLNRHAVTVVFLLSNTEHVK